MKLTVKIETSAGPIEFNRNVGVDTGYRYDSHRESQELTEAAKQLQAIANAVSSMCGTTPVVQISEKSMTAAAEAAIREYRQELAAKSKAGKQAAAERRNA